MTTNEQRNIKLFNAKTGADYGNFFVGSAQEALDTFAEERDFHNYADFVSHRGDVVAIIDPAIS